ncbi:uncharacterized protein Dwil_GK10282 [Drosophila willistoni]|uniref:MYND-type domain-containing protein n=1 Tax=Drosophila willistoni TaxID=7260 RepID=B4MJ82_DROWI|nr:uncharacterized protein LOC6638033 isoform X2 [Drosophila willistoni]EDW72171.2 uncharacterized protein Dwil_GK10282 [Drosophila willistoni]
MATIKRSQDFGSSPFQCWVCMEQYLKEATGSNQNVTKVQNSNKNYQLILPSTMSLGTIFEKEDDEKEVNMARNSKTPSIVCRRCKMQRYCSRNHMTKDLCQHRAICVVLTDLQKRHQLGHPFLLTSPKAISSITQLQRTISQLKFSARIKLRRPLTWREHELIGYPSYCQVCFRLDKLHTCGECGAVAYCSEHHRQSDVSKHTPEVCRTLALLCSPYRQLGDANKGIIDIPIKVEADQLQLCLEQSHLIEAFAKVTGLVVDDKPWSTIQDFERFDSCSSFSGMASICLALKHISFVAQPQDICTVYVVGASDGQILRYFQLMHLKFFFLLHKDVSQLDLCFIGCQQKMVKDKTRETISFDFQGHKRTITIHFYPMTFEDFTHMEKVDPVLIVMFDIDFGDLYAIKDRIVEKFLPEQTLERESHDWRKCLTEVLHVYGVPICFTSSTKALTKSNYTSILQLANKHNIKVNYCHGGNLYENPYREILPERNQCPMDCETIIYANNYLEVIFTGPKN